MIEKIRFLRPGAVNGRDFRLRDDGEGPYIELWNLPEPEPAKAELLALDTDPAFLDHIDAVQQKRDRIAAAPEAVKAILGQWFGEVPADTKARVYTLDAQGVKDEIVKIEQVLGKLAALIREEMAGL